MERGWGGGGYRPYFDPDYDSLTERINPPSVCVDNEACDDYTLVKVDSANKHGILLEMVQVLSDLDLVISKSYISSDGGWVMDVFHVTDQFGRKLSDRSLISYIQQSLVSRRWARSGAGPVQTCLGRVVAPREATVASPSSEHTALELTGVDRPGLLSELSAVLVEHGRHVLSAQAWTHNSRVACVLYLGEQPAGGAISDRSRLAELEQQLQHVVAAHHGPRERWGVTVRAVVPAASQVQTERRLHQLMHEDRDFEEEEEAVTKSRAAAGKMGATVSIESCKEKGYSVVSIRSRDRPKLLFDTVCTLTDMNYVVFHATVGSHGPGAVQEYFIRRMDGHPLDSEAERRRVARCLVAAIERRVTHGMRLNVVTPNRIGLLSDVTRVFRENGLSMTAAEIGTRGERAVGTFYVMDASGGEVDLHTVDRVRVDIGGTVAVEVDESPGWPCPRSNSEPGTGRKPGHNGEERPRFSLGSLFWSHIGRLSNNFGPTRS
uniref:ACT domain-containing protein ACR n=1 Tax=Anthurium amnicola TaxID=1678845 RepID=A0A1D1ZDZ0_9ARAE